MTGVVALTLAVAVCNVPIKVRRAAWAQCWRETARRSTAFGLNESFSRAQRRTYRQLAKRAGWAYWGLWRGPNPVFYDPGVWRFVAARQHGLHGRLRWWPRWPGYNSARHATVVALRHRETGQVVTFICTHLVPRGNKVHPRSRIRARAKSVRRLERILATQRRLGRITVLMGDMNMSRPPELPGVVWLAEGIDQIGIAALGAVVDTRYPASRFRAPTDHRHGTAATIRIERKIR